MKVDSCPRASYNSTGGNRGTEPKDLYRRIQLSNFRGSLYCLTLLFASDSFQSYASNISINVNFSEKCASAGFLKPFFFRLRVNSRKNVPEASGRRLIQNVPVAATFLDDQGLPPFGHLIQLLLAAKDLVVQACQVQFCTC